MKDTISSKAFWVKNRKARDKWEELERKQQKGELTSNPEDFFRYGFEFWNQAPTSRPFHAIEWLKSLELSNSDYYYLLTEIAKDCDTSKEPQLLLFEEIQKERKWLEDLGEKPIQVEPFFQAPPSTLTTPKTTNEETEEVLPLSGVAKLTNNELALLLYFFDKTENKPSSTVTKFGFLLQGKNKDYKGSELYKKVRKAPEANSNEDSIKHTLKDFDKIKELLDHFELFEMTETLKKERKKVEEGVKNK